LIITHEKGGGEPVVEWRLLKNHYFCSLHLNDVYYKGLILFIRMLAIRGNHRMRIKGLSTSMGIALTILLAGIVVQVTDYLELFGHNSVIPVIIGLAIIVVGVLFFLLLHRSSQKSSKDLTPH
jgi:hypothetical protein